MWHCALLITSVTSSTSHVPWWLCRKLFELWKLCMGSWNGNGTPALENFSSVWDQSAVCVCVCVSVSVGVFVVCNWLCDYDFNCRVKTIWPTHNRQWVCPSGSWRSVCPCWKPHRWVSAHPPLERPCGSYWIWLSSHHCLPADRKHIWQFRQGADSLCLWHCHSNKSKEKNERDKNNPLQFVLANAFGKLVAVITNVVRWSVINRHIRPTFSAVYAAVNWALSIFLHLPNRSHACAAHPVIKAIIVVIKVKATVKIDKQ